MDTTRAAEWGMSYSAAFAKLRERGPNSDALKSAGAGTLAFDESWTNSLDDKGRSKTKIKKVKEK